MKKITLIALVVCISTMIFAEKLVFYTQDFPPFSYEINGVISGPGAEIINAVCQKINIEAEFGLFPWKRAIALAKKGEANALFVMGWNKKRTEWLYFSPPILETEYGLFYSKDSEEIYSSHEDLANKTIGVFGPSNTATSLEKISKKTFFNIDMTIDDIAAFRKLDAKRIDGVYSNKDVGFAMINKLGLKNIKYAGKDRALNYFIGFLKNNNSEETVKKFNACFEELKKNGTIKQILKKYGINSAK